MGKINTEFDHIKDTNQIKELSVVLYPDSFFYGLWDTDDQLVRVGNSDLSRLSDLLRDINNDFDLTIARVMSTSKPYVHIPGPYFEEEGFDSYFSGIYPLRKVRYRESEVDRFVREDICTLHYMDSELLELTSTFDFPFKTGHISTAMANYSFLIEKDTISYISNNTLHISSSKQGEFRFYNQFDCYHKEDYLYFYMLAFNGLDISPSEEEIQLGGNINQSSALYQMLESYLPGIEMQNDFIISDTEHPRQYYFDLYLCKSCV
ncbi:MAG: DUF3822 family protein [Saprospiraceae bacterium]|nr:DUF3822 family protein [Saprospiraceae bacterium]